MSTRSDQHLKDVFKQAAEIASQVPESMQEAAFNRALDLLTRDDNVSKGKPSGADGGRKRVNASDSSSQKKGIDILLLDIDSTRYPQVKTASKALDRSLMILQIALNDHNVDGLTSVEISKILKEKFRLSTTRQAVGMALKAASDLVDRIADGNGYRYKIMSPGEDYLAKLQKTHDPSKPKPATPKRKKTESSGSKTGRTTASGDGGGAKATEGTPKKNISSPRTQSSGKIGPKAAVEALIKSGFLDTPKTCPEVQEHLKKKRGFDLGLQPLGLAMLRLVRDEVLERDENEEGNYEYKRS